jgi:hypothetical protein
MPTKIQKAEERRRRQVEQGRKKMRTRRMKRWDVYMYCDDYLIDPLIAEVKKAVKEDRSKYWRRR